MRYSLNEAVQHVYQAALERTIRPDSTDSLKIVNQLIESLEALWPSSCQEFREAMAYRCAREYRARN